MYLLSFREHQYLFMLDLLLTLHMEILLFWQIKLPLNWLERKDL